MQLKAENSEDESLPFSFTYRTIDTSGIRAKEFTPTINSKSRMIATKNLRKTVSNVFLAAGPNKKLVKRSNRDLGLQLPAKLDVKIEFNRITAAPALKKTRKSSTVKSIDTKMEYLKDLKTRMERSPKQPNSPDARSPQTKKYKKVCQKVPKNSRSIKNEPPLKDSRSRKNLPKAIFSRLSPSSPTIGMSAGFDIDSFLERAKPVVSYNILPKQ